MTIVAPTRMRPWVAIGLALTGLLLAWLAVRNAALNLYADRPAVALAFWPQGSGALAAAARARIAAAGGRVDATARALTQVALARQPRSAAPVLLSGLAASAGGDLTRATALIRIAEAFDPRDDIARYWLLDHDVRTGDYRAALDEIGPALHLRAGTRDVLFALVDGFLHVQGGFAAVRAKLATRPDWREAFFTAQAAADPVTLLALLRSLPPLPDRDAAAREQQPVLTALIAKGAFAQAHAGWLALSHPQPTAALVYDPEFKGLPGATPFNWRLLRDSDADAGAEIAGGRLTLSFAGGPTTVLAEQYGLAAPGTYHLSVTARRINGKTGHRLAARVLCVNGDAEILSIPLDMGAAWRRFDGELTVPSARAAIRVQIVALADTASDADRAEIAAVRLMPA